MPLGQRTPRVEVVDGGSNGGESREGTKNSGGGTGLSGLTLEMLREMIAAEVRNATSHSSTLPPQPQASPQGIGESIVSRRTGTLGSMLNALTGVSRSARYPTTKSRAKAVSFQRG